MQLYFFGLLTYLFVRSSVRLLFLFDPVSYFLFFFFSTAVIIITFVVKLIFFVILTAFIYCARHYG